MDWLNPFGALFMLVIMAPNVIFAIRQPDGFSGRWDCRPAEIIEQVGRYGCFASMIFNIPGTWFGWWSDEAFALYLIIDTVLMLLYCLAWAFSSRMKPMLRAVLLSAIPSLIFLFSGMMSRSVLLTASALLFAPAHVLISCKNAQLENDANQI